MKNLGNQIKEARILLQLTRSDVAETMQVARTTISNWECGRSEPDLHMFRKLSDVLQLNFFSDHEENPSASEPTGRKLRLKLTDSPAIEVILAENACIFSAGSINLQVNGSDSHGNPLVFRINAGFYLENDGE